jgi:hypothetical protein
MTLNKELLQRTLDTIKQNPSQWDQQLYHCGTSHCFAGFAHLLHKGLPLSYIEPNPNLDSDGDHIPQEPWTTPCIQGDYTKDYAQKALGLSNNEAYNLFNASNTLKQLEIMVDVLINKPEIL